MNQEVNSQPIRTQMKILVMVLVVITVSLPILIYALIFGGVPTVSAIEARNLLTADGSSAVLVDVRPNERFMDNHIAGSINWPLEEIQKLKSTDRVPPSLRGKELLLLCDGGIKSALAVRKLQSFSLESHNIHGGIQSWIATSSKIMESDKFSYMQSSREDQTPLPFMPLSRFEQLVPVIASFFIKPIYMILSLFLVILLWRSTTRDLVALRWGIILFLIGETACIFNTTSYFIIGEQSDLYEYIHGIGMALFLSFLSFAVMDGFDQRIVHYSHPGRQCILVGLCRSCIKYKDVPCGLERVFKITIPVMAILAIMPLNARLSMESYNTEIINSPFNFAHPAIHQLLEIRYLPIMAIFMFTVSFLIIEWKNVASVLYAKIFLAGGIGALLYSLLMLTLLTMYLDSMVWFIFWEEGTELLLIGTIVLILFVFRKGISTDRESHFDAILSSLAGKSN